MRIAVVEDDDFYRRYLQHIIELIASYHVTCFKDGAEFLDSSVKEFDVVSLDYSLPDLTCEELIKQLRLKGIRSSIIVVSAQEDVSTAVQLLKNGVFNYVVKGDDTKEHLHNTLRHLSERVNLEKEIEHLSDAVYSKYNFRSLIKGGSQEIERVFAKMNKAISSNITVSISGETGTGKELVAKAIHYNSVFANKPFVAVNMAAIPVELIETELFGHEKGAFTGADQQRIGKFEEANGGTLFLDEVGELPVPMQAKLLRVLQEREVVRVGANKPIKLKLRIIVATHKDLNKEVEKGNFRNDLLYRILGLPIHVPPLRERKSDIYSLAKHFSDEFSQENEIEPKLISKAAKIKLMRYPWPGNVRELKAVIELATILADANTIEEKDITLNSTSSVSDLLLEEKTLREYTNAIIQHSLIKNNGNVVRVAEKLDVGKSTIYRLIKNGEVKLN